MLLALFVRRAMHEHRKRSGIGKFTGGSIDVGPQYGAVTHGNGDVLFDGVLGRGGKRGRPVNYGTDE
jgi:hypothetical protein